MKHLIDIMQLTPQEIMELIHTGFGIHLGATVAIPLAPVVDIVLTGQGKETARETGMGPGAFAYQQKPVDIDVLSETMKKANEKIEARKQAQQGA